MLKWVREIWAGILVGIANIIPGVSGGTLLFMLGLYERTITAVSGFGGGRGAAMLKHCWGVLAASGQRKNHYKMLVEQAWLLDIPFLIRLIGGAGLAIVLLSGAMSYLLENQFANTYAFFFGLIAMSAVISVKMLKTKKAVLFVHFLLGATVTVAMTAVDDPVGTAEMKSARYKERVVNESVNSLDTDTESVGASSKNAFKYLGQYGVRDFAAATISGIAAVCAMILPGLSGSLMLILFGQYQEVISAISNLKTLQLDYLVFLLIMGGGMVIGLLLFVKIVEFVFKRFHDGTVAFLIGLMVGSLYALWPFKRIAIMAEQYVKDGAAVTMMENAVIRTNVNILPDSALSAVLALILCGAGVGIMIVLEKYSVEKKSG